MKKFNLLIFFLAISIITSAQKYYTVDQISNPKIAGQDFFVSDPDRILNNVSAINEVLVNIEKQTSVEFAVVIVNNFDKDQEDFEFAKALFERWGIGKAGSNNGLLLFIAKDRRKYRFISGSGVEGLLPDVILKQTGEGYLVPAFKENLYDQGILNAINEISDKLTNPESRSEILGLISQEKKKSFDWKFALGGSLTVILLFFFVFRIVNKQAKNNEITINKNGKKKVLSSYDAVSTKGCVGIFLFVFFSAFLLIFTGGLGLFKHIGVAQIPIILYSILAIGLLFRYYFYIVGLRRTHNDDKNFLVAVNKFHRQNWWLIIFSPLILVPLIIHVFKKQNR